MFLVLNGSWDLYPQSVPRLMSEVLRSPWILHSVLDDLSNDPSSQSGLNHLHRTPKLAQIIQVSRVGPIDGTVI